VRAITARDVRRAGGDEEKMKDIHADRVAFMAQWQGLVCKPTEEQFLDEWRSIMHDYAGFPSLITHLEEHQLPY
jgi:hypothetical protein